ncbi:hypothetical protein NEE01_02210 [Sphingomonas sp. MMSM24]|uniref:Uncharacterized protein n=1 Tax=Sphingomonas lycopersici TaxID=2951807 RepID=A0AA41Z690_9SPHN|nr:hypothetical protein [Sphingomonas lycopersici]
MSYRPASIGGPPAVSNAFFAQCRCKKDMSGGQRASAAKATCAGHTRSQPFLRDARLTGPENLRAFSIGAALS